MNKYFFIIIYNYPISKSIYKIVHYLLFIYETSYYCSHCGIVGMAGQEGGHLVHKNQLGWRRPAGRTECNAMSRCSRAAHFVDNADSKMKSWNCKYQELHVDVDVASEAQMVWLDWTRPVTATATATATQLRFLVNVYGFAFLHLCACSTSRPCPCPCPCLPLHQLAIEPHRAALSCQCSALKDDFHVLPRQMPSTRQPGPNARARALPRLASLDSRILTMQRCNLVVSSSRLLTSWCLDCSDFEWNAQRFNLMCCPKCCDKQTKLNWNLWLATEPITWLA